MLDTALRTTPPAIVNLFDMPMQIVLSSIALSAMIAYTLYNWHLGSLAMSWRSLVPKEASAVGVAGIAYWALMA